MDTEILSDRCRIDAPAPGNFIQSPLPLRCPSSPSRHTDGLLPNGNLVKRQRTRVAMELPGVATWPIVDSMGDDGFSRRLTDARAMSGISQAELSRLTGLSTGYISRLMRGHRGERPGSDVVAKLATGLQVDPTWLASGSGGPISTAPARKLTGANASREEAAAIARRFGVDPQAIAEILMLDLDGVEDYGPRAWYERMVQREAELRYKYARSKERKTLAPPKGR